MTKPTLAEVVGISDKSKSTLKSNYDWLMANRVRLIQEKKLRGKYALVYQQQLVSSNDKRTALQNEARMKNIEDYNIFSIC